MAPVSTEAMLGRLLLAALLAASLVAAVDRNNFKTCEQSAFCRRHRDMPEGASKYTVRSNIETSDTGITFTILNTETNVELAASFEAFEGATGRLRIREKAPIRARYEVQDVVNPHLVHVSSTIGQQTEDGFVVNFGECAMAVTYQPFRIDFLRKEAVVISLNSRGLFNFEHYRERQEGDEEGMWEEDFKTHKDTKPYGPSSLAIDVSFPGVANVYGIPEHADDLSLKPTRGSGADRQPYRLYNLDVFEYELEESMALYGSIPYMVGHKAGQTSGFLFLNPSEMWVDVKKTETSAVNAFANRVKSMFTGSSNEEVPQTDSHWIAESGIMDFFVFLGPSPKEVFHQYATVTGFSPLPPLFSLAYHQCRWNYNDQEDVRFVTTQMDEHDIPFDVIWLDIEHTDGKRYMTWDQAKFPEPEAMQKFVASTGRRMVNIVDPHIKRAGGYHLHENAQKLDYYIKDRDNKAYDGWCWPGSSSWLDFLNPEIRSWWADMINPEHYKGTTLDMYFWNDMNEPSVFNGPEVTMHKDAKHFGGWEHRDVHNIYGMWQQASTAEGIKRRSGGSERPFVLSRAFFAGSQRYGAIWTGDNTAGWDHLAASLPMVMSIGVAGLPFAGADMGGFFGNPDAELLVRWYQAGAHQPFMRAHAHIDTKRREPYLLEEAERGFVRDAVRSRYQLLPYVYTEFYLAEQTGTPVMRPLWVDFPADDKVFAEQEEHLLGSSMLIAPVLEAGHTTKRVYFPANSVWYDMQTWERFAGGRQVTVMAPLDKIPVYQRAGSIIPKRMRVRRSSRLMAHDPFTLYIAVDPATQSASGQLYLDDTHTFSYTASKQFLLRNFELRGQGQTYTFSSRAAPESGSFETPAWVERLVIVGLENVATISEEGRNVEFSKKGATLVVKKPWVNSVADDFTLTITLA